MRKTKSES